MLLKSIHMCHRTSAIAEAIVLPQTVSFFSIYFSKRVLPFFPEVHKHTLICSNNPGNDYETSIHMRRCCVKQYTFDLQWGHIHLLTVGISTRKNVCYYFTFSLSVNTGFWVSSSHVIRLITSSMCCCFCFFFCTPQIWFVKKQRGIKLV